MGYFFKNHQNLSKNTPFLRANEGQKDVSKEQGRSMVEMLGVLAITGVLSIGAISGYRYAMNKYRANQTVNELNLLSHQVAIAMMSKNGLSGTLKLGEPYDTNHKLTSSGYDIAFGCGEIGTNSDCVGQTKFYMQVNRLSKGVCRELEKTGTLLSLSDTVSVGGCDADQNNTLVFAFKADQSSIVSEITDVTPEMSGEYSSNDPEETISRIDEAEVICSFGNKRYDSYGYNGATGQYESFAYCECARGYRGEKCEIKDENTCNGHGFFVYGLCSCDDMYAGQNCESLRSKICLNGGWKILYGYHGFCECSWGWSGEKCDVCTTPETCALFAQCSGHGIVNEYSMCECFDGWYDSDCSKDAVCSGHGELSGGYCICDKNYQGTECSNYVENICSGHGRWGYGNCFCDGGYNGDDCSVDTSCSGNGTWDSDKNGCVCSRNYRGDDCSINDVMTCSGRGVWMYGNCSCDSGWIGSNCEIRQ